MKCPICGNKLEIKNKQIGTDNSGDPVFNEYAVCRDCKKQWNLDKQRAKKAAAKASAKKAEAADKTSRKKNESDVAQKKDENKIKKAHKEPEAALPAAPKTRCCRSFPKSFRPGEVTAQNKTAAEKKQLTRKQFGFRKIPKRKSRKESLHPNKLLKNQLRTKINGTVTSHRNKSAQNGRKLLKKAMMICLQQEFLILTK